MKYFAKIKYLGTAFHGFQVQPELRTVQGELNAALNEAFGLPCKVTGCSRTDAGVHANEFCLTVECDGGTIPADKLPIAVSRFLPEDLSLFYAKECNESFHPRYDVKEKEYLYRIMNTRIYDPFYYGRVWFLPRYVDDAALEKMNAAAKHFLGRHDFSTFMAEGSDVEDTVRNITSLSVAREGDIIDVRISADGFLYNMVRIIVGTLTEVAFGRISPDDIPEIIASRDRSRAGMTAPAEGLYLNRVVY
ncbi:MAG: tRNA pseudouridine(38-40) synthase TruA [Clostridia bacterium]|nr:tRNA pseudouridine(38-40) synthase TruA [Clostridia bacterium]